MNHNDESLDYLTGRINFLFEFKNHPYRIFWEKYYKKYVVGFTILPKENETIIPRHHLIGDVRFEEAYSFLKGVDFVLNLKGIK